ncbi:MAG: ribonuclease P protein component [Saprospiraceae bacterium]|nr:ribonuclease P protein component [Saprospiraceae bacterium]
MPDFSFTRQERLKSRTLLSRLFKEGHSFVAYPIRVAWLELPASETFAPVQVVVSAPKRHFKTAVARNLLKRRIREAYRLHKHELYEKLAGRRVALMLMYLGKEELPFAEIEAGVLKMIRKWPEQSAEKQNEPS